MKNRWSLKHAIDRETSRATKSSSSQILDTTKEMTFPRARGSTTKKLNMKNTDSNSSKIDTN